jgi:hypothetical protein
MPRNAVSFLVLALSLTAFSACDRPVIPTAPGAITSTPSAAFSAQLNPQSLPLVPLQGFGCPSSSPFQTAFNVVVGSASSDLFLREITLQPFDRAGIGGSRFSLSAADITGVAGAAFIGAGNRRTFNVSHRFGCGISIPQVLAIDVIVADSIGLVHHATLNADFRP